MPIMKVSRSANGVTRVDTVDSGERKLSPSERARLQLLESKREQEAAEAKAAGATDDSQKLVHPAGVGEVDETDRTDEDGPRGETVSVERIRAATGGSDTLPPTVEQETGRLRDAQRHQRKDSRPNPDEDNIAAMLEAGLGPDPDEELEDTTVLDDPQPKPAEPAPADPPQDTDGTTKQDASPSVNEYDCPVCQFPIKTAAGRASHMGAKHPEEWKKLQAEQE